MQAARRMALAALVLAVAGCGGVPTGGEATTAPSPVAEAEHDPQDDVSADLQPDVDPGAETLPVVPSEGRTAIASADGCEPLHAAVMDELTRVADRADDALGDTGLEDIIAGLASPDGALPPELVFLEGLAPGRPYGGVAGSAAESRYTELGCTPDDEYPALTAHLGVPDDAGDEQLRAVLDDDAPSAGDAVTLGLVRRLLEGSATGDDADVLVSALETAVAVQEAVRASTGSYTEQVDALIDAGLPPEFDDVEGVFLLVLAADAGRYCMTVAGDRGVAYVESHDAVPVVESRHDPAQWCAATFGDLG